MILEKSEYVVIVRGPTPTDIAQRVSGAHAATLQAAKIQRTNKKVIA